MVSSHVRMYGHIKRLDDTINYHVNGYTRKSGVKVRGYDVTRKIYHTKYIEKNFTGYDIKEQVTAWMDELAADGWTWTDKYDDS